jgi:DNA-binding NtrC family response regulator
LPHILIVDDDQQLLKFLARNFTRAGYEVSTAATAFDAMASCAMNAFDLVLSDVDMPRMNGHELARWIAGNHPRTRCVLMSGSSTECDECPLAGRCLLLRKPFVPRLAIATVASVLSERPN